MHLLVDDSITSADIEEKLRGVGIQSADIHVIGHHSKMSSSHSPPNMETAIKRKKAA